ncbi:LysE family transporter [Actinomadura montaniterrae]|uniref:Lysine transporter LysE n=1 Tax=Actinomadura montaniterrae TaxID=1803903 RepID=A0A6L3W312_9ACTN|nr:LysE family transporter [Actinomadura montaniterrae]KAB2388647.1 lysine transporter LysE [Actinomadura montaniterrae]
MTTALATGAVAGLGIAMQVGAVTVYLLVLSSMAPVRVGAAAALGVATVDGLYSALAVAVGGVASRVVEPVVGPLRWAAAAVLLWIAVRVVIDAVREGGDPSGSLGDTSRAPSPARAYVRLIGITVMNPGTVLYFTAIVIGGHFEAFGAVDRSAFAVAAFTASAVWQMALVLAGAASGRLLTGDRGRLVTGVAAGTLIAALAVRTLVQ